MKIGELALAAQTQVETIRYYEREGLLLQPPRSEGNYRAARSTRCLTSTSAMSPLASASCASWKSS